MPGIPLVAREITCSGAAAEQMCRQDSHVYLTTDEEAAAEESLAVYCKPVELYNIIQSRAVQNPLCLQRCMSYKIEAKHKRRIQLSVSLHLSVDHGLQVQSIFPLYIIVARPASIAEHSARFHFKRCITLSACAGKARFFLPLGNKLSAEMKRSSLAILFISCAEPDVHHMDFASFLRQGGQCMLSRIPMELLDLSCGKSPNLREGSETILTVDLYPCVIKASCVDGERCVSFQKAPPSAILAPMQRLEVTFTAKEIGSKYQPPYNSHASGDIPSSSLPHISRSRIGNIAFNYMYYNNRLKRTEVTEDFTCPFCLVKCASFKGLRSHLCSSHDLFKYVFLTTEENQAVNVSVRTDTWRSETTEEFQAVNVSFRTDTWRSEIFGDRLETLKKSYFFCAKPRRRKPMSIFPSTNHVHPLVLESDLPMETDELRDEHVELGASSRDATRVSPETAPPVDPTITLPLPGRAITAAPTLQFAKTRKLSVERSDPKNNTLLQKRQFFHSHQAQPMALEEVLSDQDSEDEIDDDVADLEDRRMLDDFLDVTKDEKQIMHMWNSFARRQRVLSDGHVPWACETFSKVHAAYLVQTPSLLWCWKLFLVKLWNHGLIDAVMLNKCNKNFDQLPPEQDIRSVENP